MLKPKVIISACLLGECCRYDGKTKQVSGVIKSFESYEIIPFCPEAPLFGTPRERINVVRMDEKNRIITDETNKDVTQILEDEIYAFIKKNPHANKIVLKSKSPSCGLGTTPILNKKKKIIDFGDGIAAYIFKKEYQNSEFLDETAFI
jgi:uncharacterized protein YbbK (DUF523 family)